MVHGNIKKDNEASHTVSNAKKRTLIAFPKISGKPSLSGEQTTHNFSP